jgi:hypothetical protein
MSTVASREHPSRSAVAAPYEDSPEARLGDYLSRHLYISNVFTRDRSLRITHEGAVRRAELEQQLKAGRIKEPMGLVWDGRHFHQDARISLLDAAPERRSASSTSTLTTWSPSRSRAGCCGR